MWDKTNKRLAMVFLVLLVIALYVTFNVSVQAQYCQLKWYKYFSYWYQYWISFPMWCCGYSCVPACQNYYGGWGPCR